MNGNKIRRAREANINASSNLGCGDELSSISTSSTLNDVCGMQISRTTSETIDNNNSLSFSNQNVTNKTNAYGNNNNCNGNDNNNRDTSLNEEIQAPETRLASNISMNRSSMSDSFRSGNNFTTISSMRSMPAPEMSRATSTTITNNEINVNTNSIETNNNRLSNSVRAVKNHKKRAYVFGWGNNDNTNNDTVENSNATRTHSSHIVCIISQ